MMRILGRPRLGLWLNLRDRTERGLGGVLRFIATHRQHKEEEPTNGPHP